LLLAAAVERSGQNGLLELFELVRCQDVVDDQEAVTIELLALMLWDETREPRSTPICEGMGDPQPPNVKSRGIEGRRSKQRVIRERFGSSEKRQKPPRGAPPAEVPANRVESSISPQIWRCERACVHDF